ncbi:MAG: copR 1 [Planctomycetaceae bacterium]|nr:copR 1 [Planctomycetaceae bacterium]
MARLLVVEDQNALRNSLQKGLEEEGHTVFTAMTGVEAYTVASKEPLDAILLDLLLPDGDGLQTLRQLRHDGFAKPILIVTARDALQDRILGLDSGADDYLVKPFAFTELVARLRALLRRSTGGTETILRFDDLEINLLTRTVKRAGEEIDLTQRQYLLLEYLLRNKQQVVSREMIAREVWKASTATWTNVIEVLINQLRKKLEKPDLKPLLHTVRGVGYVLGDRP